MDGADKIRKIFPDRKMWEGCVYLVSELVKPDFIKETGNLDQLYFGTLLKQKDKLIEADNQFKKANIQTDISYDIMGVEWKKSLFISTFATITSFYDTNIGLILADSVNKNQLLMLFGEIIAEIEKMSKLPYESTSSINLYFKRGKSTELNSLKGYIVHLGKDLGIKTPIYDMMYDALRLKSSSPAV